MAFGAQLVRVQVKAGSSKGPLVEEAPGGRLVVYVRERAVEGAANVEPAERVSRPLT